MLGTPLLDAEKIRNDFPILQTQVNGKPLIYFDNGATTQKPQSVLDAILHYYTQHNSNIHRGVHSLSQKATEQYEQARATVQKHIKAASPNEIIFTRGTTESINLVAHSFGSFIFEGDEIIISAMEHHSNILPWQVLCQQKKAHLKIIPIQASATLCLDTFKTLVSEKTKLIALTQVSNTTGVVNEIEHIIRIAKQKNIPVLIDGAQAVPHIAVDVQKLDCDFYCFSGHKIYAPTGIGVLYAKQNWVEKLSPYQTGGGIIKTVSFEHTEYVSGALKFEAGTPNIEGAIGLAAALNYVNQIGMHAIFLYESRLLQYATEKLRAIPEVLLYGDVPHKAAVLSFNIKNNHPFDVGTLLDRQGVAVRTGHHCTQPLMQCLGVPGTIRASFSFYNTLQEVDFFVTALKKAIKMLS